LLIVYVPDDTRQKLKNIISSVYGSVHELVKETFPGGSDKLKVLFSQATYTNIQQVDPTLEQKRINERFEGNNIEEDNQNIINEQEPSIDHKQIREFYEINRDKLMELMNILGETSDDTNE